MSNRIPKRVWIASPFVLILLAIPGYHLAKSYRFDTDAPSAKFPPAASLAEARAQDVEHLKLFFDLERSWTPQTLGQAEKRYDQLKKDAKNMSDAEFELAVARVVSAADNGHTKIREYNRTPQYNRLPVRGHAFDDGYYIIRAHRGYEHLLGKRLAAIDEQSMADIRSELRQFIGGNEQTFDKYLPYLLESPQLLHAAGLSSSPNEVSLTLINNEGEVETHRLVSPFPSSSEQIARSHVLLAPAVYAQSQPEWTTVHAADANQPLYLKAPFQEFQFVQPQGTAVSYLQFWSNNDSRDINIKDFCEESLSRFRHNPTKVLIIDHRFNGGGNSDKTAKCMTDFGRSVPKDGRLYVAIAGPTFSAGIISAVNAVIAGGDRATIIGSPVGDRLISWAEDNLLKLPNSGIEIKFSTGKHDLINGCKEWRDCFWGNLFSDLRIDSLEPDIHASLTFEDYLNRRDPIMEVISAQVETIPRD